MKAELGTKSPWQFAMPVVALILCGCSPAGDTDALIYPDAIKTVRSEDKPKTLFDGAGEEGLPIIAETSNVADEVRSRLFSIAYDGREPGSFVVTDDRGVEMDANPSRALRLGDELYLVVDHFDPQSCHFCAGSASIFRFDEAGTRLIASYRFAIPGAGWGAPPELDWVEFADGATGLHLKLPYSGQGYYCNTSVLFSLTGSGVRKLAIFPVSYDDADVPGTTRIQLIGLGMASDGRSVTLKYAGRTGGEVGGTRTLSEERQVTLDGVDDSWIENWPYRC